MSTFRLAQLILLAATIVPACSRANDSAIIPNATLVIPLSGQVQSLDPTNLADPETSRIVWQIYEGLVGLDSGGAPLPLLAESWSANADFTRWTFNLRSGVTFHPHPSFGPKSTREVVADDVLYSYTRFAKGFGSFVFSGLVEGFNEYVSGSAPAITGFAAPSPHVFEIGLTRSDPSFIFRLTSPYMSVCPREVVESAGDEFGRSVAAGTGPFRLVTRGDTELQLSRNEKYWRESKGNIQTVIFRVETNPEFRLSRMEAGEYSIVEVPLEISSKIVPGDQPSDRFVNIADVYRPETFNAHYLGMDCAQLDDVELRRAISAAVDVDNIVTGLFAENAARANSPVPQGMQQFAFRSKVSCNPEMARQFLKSSRYDGHAIDLVATDRFAGKQVAELVQAQLQSVGISTKIEILDFGAFISRLFGGSKPPLFVAYSEWVFSAPELVLQCLASSGIPNPNVFSFRDEEVDRLLSSAAASDNRKEINRLCGEAMSVADTKPPAVWLYHARPPYLVRKDLNGFSVNAHQYWNLVDCVLAK